MYIYLKTIQITYNNNNNEKTADCPTRKKQIHMYVHIHI